MRQEAQGRHKGIFEKILPNICIKMCENLNSKQIIRLKNEQCFRNLEGFEFPFKKSKKKFKNIFEKK